MSDVRKEVRILIQTRVITLEAVAIVHGHYGPEEAANMVREELHRAKIYTIDPAVEG